MISAVIIVQNEEKYIENCLKNIKDHVKEIVVIDGGSVDKTQEICSDYNCKVITNIFRGHFGDQRNFGIMNSKGKWILSIDADEIFEETFFKDLPNLVNQDEYDAYKFPRKNYLDGVYDEKHYPDYQVRLFRRYCRWVFPAHEEVVGRHHTKDLSHHIIHHKDSVKHARLNDYYEKFIESYYELDFKKKTLHFPVVEKKKIPVDEEENMTQVFDKIFIGSSKDMCDLIGVKSYDIKTILVTAKDLDVPQGIIDMYQKEGISFLKIALLDGEGNSKEEYLKGVNIIKDAVEKGNVLVCCHAGRSRSPLLVALYKFLAEKTFFDESISLMKSKRDLNIMSSLYMEIKKMFVDAALCSRVDVSKLYNVVELSKFWDVNENRNFINTLDDGQKVELCKWLSAWRKNSIFQWVESTLEWEKIEVSIDQITIGGIDEKENEFLQRHNFRLSEIVKDTSKVLEGCVAPSIEVEELNTFLAVKVLNADYFLILDGVHRILGMAYAGVKKFNLIVRKEK